MHDLESLYRAFALDGAFVSGAPYGTGHINDTYALVIDEGGQRARYMLQRINHNVFREPDKVMSNIDRVTRHIRAKLAAADVDDVERRTLTLIPTRSGGISHVDAEGNTWRMYIFIENAQTYDELETTTQAYEAAKAFGNFTKQLADLPGDPLLDTIPGFHDTRARFALLQDAIRADVCGRAESAEAEITFACDRESIVGILLDLQSEGRLPLITTHNDTKLNNVMLDDATGEGICVIDLDTVMPGLSLFDFGDMVRTAARPCPEDETDLSKVVARMDMFEAIARGYLISAGESLNQTEKDHLAFSARLITFEIGIRFLTDYLQGDVYFKTHRERQNLDRTRVQFKMTKNFEDEMDTMNQLVADLCG